MSHTLESQKSDSFMSFLNGVKKKYISLHMNMSQGYANLLRSISGSGAVTHRTGGHSSPPGRET